MARLDCREVLKKLSKSENQASEALRAWQDDAMHKYTTHLVKEYDAICIEDLDVKGMLI